MTNNMNHDIMKRRHSLKRQAEEKSEEEILRAIFDTFDKYEKHKFVKQVASNINDTIDAAKPNFDVKALYDFNLKEMIKEEVIDFLAEYGDKVIAEVCKELGVEVAIPYYGKLYNHACLRYIGKVI